MHCGWGTILTGFSNELCSAHPLVETLGSADQSDVSLPRSTGPLKSIRVCGSGLPQPAAAWNGEQAQH